VKKREQRREGSGSRGSVERGQPDMKLRFTIDDESFTVEWTGTAIV
jgi:hypothetical protein